MKKQPMKLTLTNPIRFRLSSCIAALSFLTASWSPAQTQITTDHFYAGATGTSSSDQLIWGNASVFSADANYFNMSYSTSGTYSGFYNAAFTMTVLAATPANLGPVPLAPALGSYIQAKLTLVSAPVGGTFDYWLTGATTPSYTLNVGDSTALIPISDITLGAGSPGADPTATFTDARFRDGTVGDYIVSFPII